MMKNICVIGIQLGAIITVSIRFQSHWILISPVMLHEVKNAPQKYVVKKVIL